MLKIRLFWKNFFILHMQFSKSYSKCGTIEALKTSRLRISIPARCDSFPWPIDYNTFGPVKLQKFETNEWSVQETQTKHQGHFHLKNEDLALVG